LEANGVPVLYDLPSVGQNLRTSLFSFPEFLSDGDSQRYLSFLNKLLNRYLSTLQDHPWIPYTQEVDDKIDSLEVLMADPARAGQEWSL
jgi:hypothetical protein